MSGDEDLLTSAASRLLKLGGLMGKVGFSMASGAVRNLFESVESGEVLRADRLIQNALRVVDTLGNLKGAPMKIGQMLSLHEGLLPPEVTEVLSLLQKKAPPVPFSTLHEHIKSELKDRYGNIKHIETEAYAAASIGQVHRAILQDDREVVLKVQYPGIDRVIEADMKNARGLLGMIFSMFAKMDLQPVWEELNDRLHEELDYEREADNMQRAARLYADNHSIVIPEVVPEASSRSVLCMTLIEGLSPDEACSEGQSQELRDKWARVIFDLLLGGIFKYRFLHADPNLSNFAFRQDGSVIVYDFGCMKEISEKIARGYAYLAHNVVTQHFSEAAEAMRDFGVHRVDGEKLPVRMIEDYYKIIKNIIQPGNIYTFGKDDRVYERVLELGRDYWFDALDIQFPGDIIFIDRAIAGHYGNLRRFQSTGNWGDILEHYISPWITGSVP